MTLGASWDVWAHRHRNMELYGTEGALFVPDPNWFGGTVELAGRDGKIAEVDAWDHPFGVPNDIRPNASFANYRTAGLADMAMAIIEGRDARCSLDRALHGVDVMTSILKSGETRRLRRSHDHLHPPRAARPGRGPRAARLRRQPMTWTPAEDRYERMVYRRCGASGLMLPAISLGLWHNFGGDTPHETKRAICRTAFDLGITHFDLANNYGPPPGSAEEAFGEILATDFARPTATS